MNLKPLDQIKPGQRVEWKLKARANEVSDVRVRVELNSDYLDSPVPDVEPTRIVKKLE